MVDKLCKLSLKFALALIILLQGLGISRAKSSAQSTGKETNEIQSKNSKRADVGIGNGIVPAPAPTVVPTGIPTDIATTATIPTGIPTGAPTIPQTITQFHCPIPNAVVPDPFDCEHFYICISNQETQFQCLPGLGFDPTKGYCQPKGQVTACLISNVLDGVRCPSDGFQPDRLDCTKFYWCYQGSAVSMSCSPVGMKFDKDSKMCLPPDMAKCASILDPIQPTLPNPTSIPNPTSLPTGLP